METNATKLSPEALKLRDDLHAKLSDRSLTPEQRRDIREDLADIQGDYAPDGD